MSKANSMSTSLSGQWTKLVGTLAPGTAEGIMKKEQAVIGMKVILWVDLSNVGEVFGFSNDDDKITIKTNNQIHRIHPENLDTPCEFFIANLL